ncbi:hypothetical protein RhiirA1_474217 [Rhizophagus irregularis]|uniref:Uncharacterized protein n=1 Tax=Rhizophagus irregularis TaxID=588596 RepID=A0A2N0QYY7_9GLOM|nr:hypothetical protein RhiirA1_474217 [Rhizophagus irregularis]
MVNCGSPRFGNVNITIKQVEYQIGNNSYKLKGQRILTYNELPRQFQSNSRLQRAQIDPRLSRTCNGFANLSNSLTHIMSNWFIIEEHPESDDNETKVQMLKILSNYLLRDVYWYKSPEIYLSIYITSYFNEIIFVYELYSSFDT